jgi:hypothetical protein
MNVDVLEIDIMLKLIKIIYEGRSHCDEKFEEIRRIGKKNI